MPRKITHPMSPGTSFSPEILEDLDRMLEERSGIGVPRDKAEDAMYGEFGGMSPIENDQIILDMRFTCLSPGWPHIKNCFQRIVDQYKKEFEAAEIDTDNHLRYKWHVAQQIASELIAKAEVAADTPLSTELPKE
jgi:hypothetical protein